MSERVHQVKCLTPFFGDIRTGISKTDIRKNDFNFKVGEKVILYEYESGRDHCTGQWLTYIISFVLPAEEPGYVLLGVSDIIDPLKKKQDEKAIRNTERYSETQGLD